MSLSGRGAVSRPRMGWCISPRAQRGGFGWWRGPPRTRPRNDRTSPQPLVLFCFGLFWSTRRTNAFCSALPPGYTEVVQESRGDGGAAAGQGSGGRLGPAPHRPGLAGRRRPVGGDQAKIRGLSDKICSAGGRSLAICAPSAQSARRRH